MANQRWFKGNKPTQMERFLHERLGSECDALVQDLIHREVIVVPDDGDIPVISEEIRDLAETGRSIMY